MYGENNYSRREQQSSQQDNDITGMHAGWLNSVWLCPGVVACAAVVVKYIIESL